MPRQFTRDALSKHDQEVLDSIFNPFGCGEGFPAAVDADIEAELTDAPEEETEEVRESTKMELAAVALAEKGELDSALGIFEKCLQIAAQRPSVYNNRAQVWRLKGNDSAALSDLNQAIELSIKSPRTKCQAFCQRGVLYRKQGKLDNARADFQEAAKLGSKFARTQLVEINPYAALCNQMLSGAMEKLN